MIDMPLLEDITGLPGEGGGESRSTTADSTEVTVDSTEITADEDSTI